MESVQKQLEELGLSANEVKVYLASLELGAATAQQLAAKAAVARPTTYVAIGGLTKRGLMSSHTRGKKQCFQAERPGHLLKILEDEKVRLAAKEAKLKSVLPGLDSLILMSKEKPEVKYYEGLEGLETMREVLFASKAKNLDIIYNQKAVKQALPESSIVLHSYKVIKQAISGRQILLCGPDEKIEFTQTTSKFVHKLLITDDTSNFGEIALFSDYIALTAYLDKPFGFLLKSKDLAGVARAMFNLAWESKKLRTFKK
jgi:sugar-specific transcriptional regulator TrmB